jgi:cytochrome c oxidase assembly protein subunit 15
VLDKYVRFGRIVLGYVLFVILWGAWVRASGSGAGCGDHWPLCDGALIPATPALTTLIELFHRATSGVAFLLVLALFLYARRVFGAGHPARRAAGASFVLITVESLIGAVIVLAGLFGDNASLVRGATVGAHFVNTLVLLAALVASLLFVRDERPLQWRNWDRTRALLWLGMIGWLALGATGAVGALSRTLYPSNSLVEALTKEFAPDAPLLLRLRSLHVVVAVGMGAYLSVLAIHLSRRSVTTSRLAVIVTSLFFAQSALGMANVLLVVPTPVLQLSHLLLMDVLWMAYVVIVMRESRVQAEPNPRPNHARGAYTNEPSALRKAAAE